MSMSRYEIIYNHHCPGGMSIKTRLSPKSYENKEVRAIIVSNLKKTRDEIMGDNSFCVCGSEKKTKDCHKSVKEGSMVFLIWQKYLALSKEVERLNKEGNVKSYVVVVINVVVIIFMFLL